MINVTKSYLPPLEEYHDYLKEVWERCWLTNYGPLMVQLEKSLKKYLGVKHLFMVNNGTMALQMTIKAMGLKGEIITTPFSYVATTASIVWEACQPVFVDIDEQTLCLNPLQLEEAITPNTAAILATHVYGNACPVEAIDTIAKKYNLKVIYDAAHAFGVEYKGQSLLNYGDVSTLSFHATKLFHTIEGGAIITSDDALAQKISYMCNFGHEGAEHFVGLGTNAKLSEMHAAMGLCVLPKVEELIAKRRELTILYDTLLAGLPLKRPLLRSGLHYNYAYYPVIFSDEERLIAVRNDLNSNEINPRRYFYPSLSTLNYVRRQEMKVAEDICTRILCLPLAHDLTETQVRQITTIIHNQFAK